MSPNNQLPIVTPSHEGATESKAHLIRVLKEKSKSDHEIASLLDQLLDFGLTAVLGASPPALVFVSPFVVLVAASNPNWGQRVDLSGLPKGQYRVIPSADSRWALYDGVLISDFHGLDATMDGNEIGIPKNSIRIGALVMLVRSTDIFGRVVTEIIDFPPGMDSWDFKLERAPTEPTDPFELYFIIADRGYGDNSGVCRVEIVATE